jgi:hypothetical protein
MALMVKELQDEHIVSIKVSGFFYKRVKSMLFRQLNTVSEDLVKQLLDNTTVEKNPQFYTQHPEAFDIQTLFIHNQRDRKSINKSKAVC